MRRIKYAWSNFQRKWNDNLQSDKQSHFKWGWRVMFIITLANEVTIKTYPYSLIIISDIMGLGVEFYQSFTRDRYVEPNDAYATIAGGVAGIVLAASLVFIGREVVWWFL